jgi:hypothetical protein
MAISSPAQLRQMGGSAPQWHCKLALYVWSSASPLPSARPEENGLGCLPRLADTEPERRAASTSHARACVTLPDRSRREFIRPASCVRMRSRNALLAAALLRQRVGGMAPSAGPPPRPSRAHDQASFTRPPRAGLTADDFARLYRRGLGVCPNAVPNTQRLGVLR